MHVSTILLAAFSASSFAIPATTDNNSNSTLSIRQESDYGWIAGFTDPTCKSGVIESGDSYAYLDSADCCPFDATSDTVGINWGTGGAKVQCGVNVFTDNACTNFATKTLKPAGGDCLSQKDNGGPWGSVQVAHCWEN